MMKTATFNVSCLGDSHIKSGRPCQDYSTSWTAEDGASQIIICCDGHGSKTYVRSDTGSRLAAEIAQATLIDMMGKVSPSKFLNKKGAVTAQPDSNIISFLTKKDEDRTEEERKLCDQKLEYEQQVCDIKEQVRLFEVLFSKIYNKWKEEITKDSIERPFTDEEKTALGNNRIEKAYGTTLMAYAQTTQYWLAFQIGDGRLLTCNDQMEWSQPVPWDCNCFLNHTTSLCGSDPIPSFRFAFDGTGYFPLATICCTDGIEDSKGDYDLAPYYLHDYLSGILHLVYKDGVDSTLEKLKKHLPELSKAGSKDDMSIAVVIDSDKLNRCIHHYMRQKELSLINSYVQAVEELSKQMRDIALTFCDRWKQYDEEKIKMEDGITASLDSGIIYQPPQEATTREIEESTNEP